MTGPAPITAAHVLTFCDGVVKGSQPVLVRCDPVADQELDDCFVTVDQQVASSGGAPVLGWAIWEVPGVLIEAEFHAVWQQPEGTLLDISARRLRFDSITFVPDPGARYAGRQVDNVRVPLNSDPRVRQFIYLCQRRFELENTGALADQHGLVELPPGIAKAHRMVVDQLGRLAKRLFRG